MKIINCFSIRDQWEVTGFAPIPVAVDKFPIERVSWANGVKFLQLEHAMSQQQFDWKHSPANDLRRALQQAQLSLEEISENKFLESSLRDLLKHRIAPAYYMQIYQTLYDK